MITLLIFYLIVSRSLNKNVVRRWDGSPAFPYFYPEDFGVEKEDFHFHSGKWLLSGSKYFVEKDKCKDIIIFFHGIGAGRNAYMKVICEFAQKGYLVYAFDYTGSMLSEGDQIYGLGHVVKDEEAFFEWLDQDPDAQNKERFAIGHSWGGYAALMSLNPLYKITKCVSMAGFDRVSIEYLRLSKSPNNKFLLALIKLYCFFKGGKYGDNSAVKLMKTTSAQVLYIQGLADEMVPPSASSEIFKKELGDRTNISFLLVPGRKHQIFLSKESEDYLGEILEKGLGEPSAPKDLKMDIAKASEDDKTIFDAIFDFLSR